MLSNAGWTVLALMVAAVYVLPAMIAYAREVSQRQTLVVVNLAFGWTLIGWIVVLMWAMQAPPEVAQLWKQGSP